jgi:hypothetical protein
MKFTKEQKEMIKCRNICDMREGTSSQRWSRVGCSHIVLMTEIELMEVKLMETFDIIREYLFFLRGNEAL